MAKPSEKYLGIAIQEEREKSQNSIRVINVENAKTEQALGEI